MKKLAILISITVILAGVTSCTKKEYDPGFEDMEQMTIYDYLVENDSLYSDFLKILKAGQIDKTLSAYNPENNGYTLFLPTNQAVEEYVSLHEEFSSLDQLLADEAYVSAFAKYHVVGLGIDANDFPFGALPENTLSNDILTVNFVIEEDTSYYKINNQAPVIYTNIEVSNGFIHILGKALTPLTFTTFDWIAANPDYSIFKAAVDLTGWSDIIDVNTKDEENQVNPRTIFIEPDSVYNNWGVSSLEDLIDYIKPGDANYTDPNNALNIYVGYHVLTDSKFLDDFVTETIQSDRAINYNTYADVPLQVDGRGIDIKINPAKEIFDTVVSEDLDTTIIDFVGIYYDDSNILTQSGAIHLVNRILRQQVPTRGSQTFEFYEEPLFNEFRQEPGEYLVEDSTALYRVKYSGADLFFVESADEEITAWGDDYLVIEGDFTISYRIPKIVQGKYNVFLGAELTNETNAVVEVYIDGKNIGGLVDLSTGGSNNNPFQGKPLGTIDFKRYSEHTVLIKSLIPGKFYWDYIRFTPYTNN